MAKGILILTIKMRKPYIFVKIGWQFGKIFGANISVLQNYILKRRCQSLKLWQFLITKPHKKKVQKKF